MARKSRDPFAPEEEPVEIIYVSKAELKRDAKELKQLGEKLLGYSPEQWSQLNLDDELIDALKLAEKIRNRREAFRRQLQFIGRLLRARDHEAIVSAMEKFGNNNKQAERELQQLEKIRADLLEQGNDKINALVAEHPEFERQKLRQLVKKTLEQQKREPDQTSTAYRQLFQYLKEVIQ